MTDGPARSQNPPLLAGVRVPGIHRAVVSSHERKAIAHDDLGAWTSKFAPQLLAPDEFQRWLWEVCVEAGALKVAMQCGPGRLFRSRERPRTKTPCDNSAQVHWVRTETRAEEKQFSNSSALPAALPRNGESRQRRSSGTRLHRSVFRAGK